MNHASAIRVLLVEDQQLIRRGLAMLLGTSCRVEVVGQADEGRSALEVLTKITADVVLTDARMPGMDGVELVAECRRFHPGLPVLVLTTFDDDELVRAALAAGAAGFLLKDTSVEELSRALRAAAEGGMVIDSRVARAAIQPATPSAGPLAFLTRAERHVAVLVARGRTNSEIAAELFLAEGTVKNHVSALLRKLDARDRTSLALTLYKALGEDKGA